MICITCKAEIPPQWVGAIKSNICPGCSGPIMNDKSKELLEELNVAISQMSSDPQALAQGIVGWILSNYALTKIGTGDPVNFHIKPTHTSTLVTTPEHTGPLKIANSPVSEFMKRSGADKVLKNPKIAGMISAINSIGLESEADSFQQEEDDEQAMLQAKVAKAKAEGRKVTMKELLTSEDDVFASESNLSDPEKVAVQSLIGGTSINELQNLNFDEVPVLQQDRIARIAKQRELMMGGVGKISRRS